MFTLWCSLEGHCKKKIILPHNAVKDRCLVLVKKDSRKNWIHKKGVVEYINDRTRIYGYTGTSSVPSDFKNHLMRTILYCCFYFSIRYHDLQNQTKFSQ